MQGAAGLVNTSAGCFPDPETDRLSTTAELTEFNQRWQWSGRFVGDSEELEHVRRSRPLLRGLWEADTDQEFVDLVNRILREGDAHPQVVEHDDLGWHVHATRADDPLAIRMQVEAAVAAIDLVRSGERSRMRICAALDCAGVLVDFSRNRSRRYCEGGCGNRIAAAAYRSRRDS
ncbi:CGNR zinc finger domain-containing protein [Dermacoccaceae bacterium W4C1]